jgi:predicted nuclease of predicted toxin-antitoxin system
MSGLSDVPGRTHETVGTNGWVVLTKDQKLRYRPLEIAALRASKARVFVLTAGNLRGAEIAAVFVRAVLAF